MTNHRTYHAREDRGDPVYDLFLSHASEDTESVARPLAVALRAAGFTVWFDDDNTLLGDSIPESIGEGLRLSRFGLLVISRRFLDKYWTALEASAIVASAAKDRRVLPVLHGVSREDLQRVYPLLSGMNTVSTEQGLDPVVAKISAVLKRENTGQTVTPAVTVVSRLIKTTATRSVCSAVFRIAFEHEIAYERRDWIIGGSISLKLDGKEIYRDGLYPIVLLGSLKVDFSVEGLPGLFRLNGFGPLMRYGISVGDTSVLGYMPEHMKPTAGGK